MMHFSWLLLLPLAPLVYSQPTNDSQSLLWGSYRPNLYFGLRPRIPQSLMTGLMWFGTNDYHSVNKIRHACDQGDGLDKYTWTHHNPRQGGVQVLRDGRNNIKVTTEFLKIAGSENGGDWAARIRGAPINPTEPSRTSMIFYFGLEGLGGLDMETREDENGLAGDVVFSGSTLDLGEFTIRVVDGSDNTPVTTGPHSRNFFDRIGKTHFLGRPVPAGNMWQAKEVVLKSLQERAIDILQAYKDPDTGLPDPSFVLQLPDDVYTSSNLYAVQKMFQGEFQFDVFFECGNSKQTISSRTLDLGIPSLISAYDERFNTLFPITSSYITSNRQALETFSKEITANLLGGVGYFYGTSIINKKFSYEWDEEGDGNRDEGGDDEKGPRLTEPRGLLTATPSRSFFPRGFYWDEGFHLLHIGEWDNDLSLEILKSWIDLIDDNGWVAREQILGEEARSKVPAEFQTQVPQFANPPTLTMAVTAFISRIKSPRIDPNNQDPLMDFGIGGSQISFSVSNYTAPVTTAFTDVGSRYLESPDLARAYLKSIYAPLKKHYDWFRRTQRGQIKQYSRVARSRTEAYRWRGRSELHVLTSGMDDYPRGPPHAGELHLDLICWMAFFTRTMKEISAFVGEKEDELSFGEIEQAILHNIEDLHWSNEQQMYCDANIDNEDESYHVCHRGYISLFPFLLSLLPPSSPHLGPIFDLIRDPNHLWSPYGLRSLSASHPEFGQGENYWKGPIWVQMNYLALGALYKTYAVQEGPHQTQAKEIYSELRKNVIDNVFKEYERTGYVWEQYDALTGEGRRSHPFTGWTSLVTLILAEKY